jgi:hypothetical protein
MKKSLPKISIAPLKEVRTCPEHVCLLLMRMCLWKRCLRGEFGLEHSIRPRMVNDPDHKGRIGKWQQNIYLRSDSYKWGELRHAVLEAYCARTQSGKITWSGLIDPKKIVIDGIFYRQLENVNPRCELCENGDMIPVEARFRKSKYKPIDPSTTRPNLHILRLKLWLVRQYRHWQQRDIVKRTVP